MPLFSLKTISRYWRSWGTPAISFQHIFNSLVLYPRFFHSWYNYEKLPGAEALRLRDAHPCLFDNTTLTSLPFGSHYFYQAIWAFKAILRSGTPNHVDVGSEVNFVGLLTSITSVTFVDIRPLIVNLENLSMRKGSILAMPFENDSITSISCLHVAEHIGLGRYGDPLDPAGTQKAIKELTRVLRPGGNLYFSLPVGKAKVCFNAHRIHSPQQILNYFHDLKLIDFSGITDKGEYRERINPEDLANQSYACGLFHFTKL